MKNLSGPYQWMIEANIGRFKEGARVLEDIARFILKDKELFKKIKNLKIDKLLWAEKEINLLNGLNNKVKFKLKYFIIFQ